MHWNTLTQPVSDEVASFSAVDSMRALIPSYNWRTGGSGVPSKKTPGAIDYSIIVPVYYNEGSLRGLLAAIWTDVVLANPSLQGELIFVDDGSGDGSFKEMQLLQAENPSFVRIVKLTRNFGQVNALLAGYSVATGKCVVSISADGQDPPYLISQMLTGFFLEGNEVVICARRDREESLYRRATSSLFYWLIRKLAFPQMPRGGFDLLLMGRRALDVFLKNRDANLFLQGQILWTGFKTKVLEYTRQARMSGRSRWTFSKKITYLVDGVMSHSYFPIRFMSLTGFVIAIIGFLYAALVTGVWLLRGNPVQGWTPIVILILLLGGTNMLMLGVVGEYVWRTLSQVRNRDPYIIESIKQDARSFQFDAPDRRQSWDLAPEPMIVLSSDDR